MTQAIDPAKLKASAEHLEWVLKQYPDSLNVRALYRAFIPLIEDAKAGKLLGSPEKFPHVSNFAHGVYSPYKAPSIDEAYADFAIKMAGDPTYQDSKLYTDVEAIRKADADEEANRRIDKTKLKAAAEHLEWVLKQYPDSEDVQGLLRSLTSLIEDAKAGSLREPMDSMKIPGAWNFSDGRYIPYDKPNVDSAYVAFSIEMRGGLSEEEKEINARMDAMRKAMNDGPQP